MNQEKPHLMLFQWAWTGGKSRFKQEKGNQYLQIKQNETKLHSSCPAKESLFPKTKPHSKNPLSVNFSSYASLSLKPRILPPSASHCSKTFSTRRIPILPTSLHSNQPLQPTALSVCLFFHLFFFFSGPSKTSSLQQLLHSLYFLSNSQKTAH